MAIQVKHKFVSAKVDTLDNSKIQPSNWNDTHDLLLAGGVVVGRAAGAGQAAATELPMGVMGQSLIAAADAAAARALIVADATQATILAAATKATPVDADSVAAIDSAAGNALKRFTWAAIKATLKTYFDTLYVAAGGTVTAVQNFVSSTATVILATTGAGVIYFRPNGLGSAVGQTYIDSAGNLVVGGGVYVNGAILGGAPDAVMEDQKASGTEGGTLNSGVWQQRDLNTEVYDPFGFVAVAANQFTPATNGWVEWSCPSAASDHVQSRLFNVTDNVPVGYSQSGALSISGQGNVIVNGGAPVVAGKAYRIEMRCSSGRANNGCGYAGNFGGTEVYTRILFWRK